MSMSKAALAVRVLGFAVVLSFWTLSAVAPAASPTATARPAGNHAAQPVINHSAPYTRLLGTAWPDGPVKFADHQVTKQQGSKTPAQPVGWHHRAGYYAGYGGMYSPYGYGGYGMGYGYGFPYYTGYAGYPFGAGNYYQPYTYSYRPWVGGWGGYPYYNSFNPGFGGYYSVGYGGGPGVYGGYGGGGGAGYGGCCYW